MIFSVIKLCSLIDHCDFSGERCIYLNRFILVCIFVLQYLVEYDWVSSLPVKVCVCARIVIASVTVPWHRRVSVWLCETWLFKRKEYFCKLLVLINYKVNSTMGIHTQKSFRSSVQVKRFGRVWIPTGRGIESTRAWSTNLSMGSKNGFIWLK